MEITFLLSVLLIVLYVGPLLLAKSGSKPSR